MSATIEQRVTFFNKFPITLEPIIFCLVFTGGLMAFITQNLIIDKVCRLNYKFWTIINPFIHSYCSDLGFNMTVCSNISSYTDENDAVETKASEINMYMSMLSSIPTMLMALFIGPWSDKNGRKPVLILPFIGMVGLFSTKKVKNWINLRLCPYNCLLDSE